MQAPHLILASTSAIRQQLLKNAGLIFTCQIPTIDEEQFKTENNHLSPQNLALALAKAKAASLHSTSDIIIGADQTLSCNGQLYTKARTLDEAKHQLQSLRGQTHTLHSAIAISQAGQILFSSVDSAHLTMRHFSGGFLETYLQDCGAEILHAVGCYQFEKHGAQLFDKIEGDYFTILGLPLLQCLAFLRQIKFLGT